MTVTDTSAVRGIVQRARALILHPRSEWAVIEGEPATVRGLFTRYVMYLAAIPPVCQFVGGVVFAGSAWRPIHPSPISLVVTGIIEYVLALGGVYLTGLIIEAVTPYFGGAKDRIQSMKVAAYFPTAAWLAGVFALIPALSPLRILGLYSLFILWLGLPRLTRTPQDKALVFTAVVILAALVVEVLILTLAGAIGLSAAMAGPTA